MLLSDILKLRKRGIIESVNDQLKNLYQIEQKRHRKAANFMVNSVAGLIAYADQPQKPSLYDLDWIRQFPIFNGIRVPSNSH